MLKKNRKIAAIITAMIITGMVTGCTSNGQKTENKSATNVIEFKDGSVKEKDLNDEMSRRIGLNVALNLADEAILNKLYPNDEEVNKKIDEQIKSLKENYGEQFEDVLKSNGIDGEEAYRKVLDLNFKREKYVVSYVMENKITDEEVKAAYDAFEPEIKASHILIGIEKDVEGSDAQAKAKAEEIIKKLDGGADFAALATENSVDRGSAANGGDLGFFGKGAMVPEFESAAFALNVGEYSKTPVKSDFGYHIILKTDAKEKGSYDDMKAELRETLAQDMLQTDKTLGDQVLIQMRKDQGLKFNNEIIKEKYEEFTKSLSEEENSNE